MRILTARWVAGCIAAGSIALMAGALVLEYVDRDLLPASMTGWTFDNVSGQVVNLAVPVVGFVLASRRPANRIGWLFLTAGLVLALEAFGAQYALRALVAAPGSLPAGRAFVRWCRSTSAQLTDRDCRIPPASRHPHAESRRPLGTSRTRGRAESELRAVAAARKWSARRSGRARAWP